VAPEPEGSSPYSQQPITSPYPEPTGATLHSPLHSPSQSPRDTFWSHPPIYGVVFQVVSFWLSHQNLLHIPVISHAYHMPRPPHSPWFDLPNSIWGWVQNMKLLIVQLLSCLIEKPLKKLAPHLPMVTPLMLQMWLQYSMWPITWLESVDQQANVDFPVYVVSEVHCYITQPQLTPHQLLLLNYR
jgi:hypothetical protein